MLAKQVHDLLHHSPSRCAQTLAKYCPARYTGSRSGGSDVRSRRLVPALGQGAMDGRVYLWSPMPVQMP